VDLRSVHYAQEWKHGEGAEVRSPRTKQEVRKLHGAMIDLFTLMNRPQRDDTLIREAGITLDRALFPLLVGIERYGPIGVVDLAERVGRDHTTVSRQVTKLESLGLVERKPSPADRRINQAVITPEGRTLTAALDAARLRIVAPILEKWTDEDFSDLVQLMRRFVDDLMGLPEAADDQKQDPK
jgi:DNA-binding MarR family transcriptional regulator